MQQSKIYQKQYQDALKKQIGSILDNMQVEEFKTVSEYLQKCYENGFVGTMYDLQGQGIPLCFPLDQEAMVRAVQLDSKISKGLYTRLGEDVAKLKKKISAQVSRGIATGMSYQQVAKQLAGVSNIGYNNAVRIARTEGHRIQVQSGMDACYKAQGKGADVVKQWDSTLDDRTRESHVAVDGEIRELDKPFSNGLMFPGDPSGGAAEVINCRCALLQRARWALDDSFTKMDNFSKQIEEFESPKNYDDFKKGFFSDENVRYMNYVQKMEEKYKTTDFTKLLDMMDEQEYKHYSEMLNNNPVFNIKSIFDKKQKAANTPPVLVGGVDCVVTNRKKHGFTDGTPNGVNKTIDATVYTTPDGVDFVFPKRYNKLHQTMTPEVAISCWQRVPQSVRQIAQKSIEFVDYYNPQDAVWKKRYKIFKQSYATGGKRITFYRYDFPHDPDYVVRTYCHEAGHFIDTTLSASGKGRFSSESVWTKAMNDDMILSGKKSCTQYGENSNIEDFAESVAEYANNRSAFTKDFPNRAAILSTII